MEPSRKRPRTMPPASQPDQPQLPIGQPSSTPGTSPTAQSPAAPRGVRRLRRISRPYDPNGPGRPPQNIVPEAAPTNPQDQGIGPPLAPAPTNASDRAVGETPNLSVASPDAMSRPVPFIYVGAPVASAAVVASPHPGAASAAGQGSGQKELPTLAPTFTAVDAYDMSGAGAATEAPSASGAEEFDPGFLTAWHPGLEAWNRTANEASTPTPTQAPQPQPQGLYHHSMELDLNFLGVRTGTHHGKCTPGRHHAGCTARDAACAAAINAWAAAPTTYIAEDFLERNGLRWVPAPPQYGGPGRTNLMVRRESREHCQVDALVVDNLTPGVDMLLCRRDAVKLGYVPALQYDEHTVATLENHHGSSCGCCMDSMPVDTQGLPPASYPRPTAPAPPAMSTTGSLGDPAMPTGGLPLLYPPPPSASGSGTNFVAAAVDPYIGYGGTLGKDPTPDELWELLNGGGDDNNHHHHHH